jgi:hypothetical protein
MSTSRVTVRGSSDNLSGQRKARLLAGGGEHTDILAVHRDRITGAQEQPPYLREISRCNQAATESARRLHP